MHAALSSSLSFLGMDVDSNVHLVSLKQVLDHGSGHGDSGTATPAKSDTMSARPKKNVKWVFGDPEEHSPLDAPTHPTQDSRRSCELFSPVASSQHVSSQDDYQNEEAQLRHLLTQTLPQQSAAETSPPQRPSLSSGDPSKPPTKPKSVLRSGTSTPVGTVSPLPEPQEEIAHLENKTKSAHRAKQDADRLSQNLAEENGHHHCARQSMLKNKGKSKVPSSLSTSSESRIPRLFREADKPLDSGQVTPEYEVDADYVPRPRKYRLAGLTAQNIMREMMAPSRRSSSDSEFASSQAVAVPGESLVGHHRRSLPSISSLIGPASSQFGAYAGAVIRDEMKRPGLPRAHSENSSRVYATSTPRSSSTHLLSDFVQKATIPSRRKKPKGTNNVVTKHVEENQLRKRYLVKLCRALVGYGAPTHRLERYMQNTSNVLQIEGQFLYLPSCMICSFEDPDSHTTEVKIVKASEGVDLGKLKDVHDVYRNVVHDEIGVNEAMKKLEDINRKPKKFRIWMLVAMHGFASAAVAPFAFHGRLADLPIAFFLGLLVGFLRYVIVAKSDIYASIFEVSSVVLTSFLSRLFGSLKGGNLFCFSALAQSSIVLILPGYIVLCGASELQNRSLVAGSVRLVFSIIYSLFIGFGLTIGSAIYGWFNKNAISESTCRKPMADFWYFFFVPPFALCLMIINQAKWKQMPIMMVIALIGYFVSFAISRELPNNAQISSALAAVAISFLANTYSRIGFKLDEPFVKIVRKVRLAVTGNARPRSDEEQQKTPSQHKPADHLGHRHVDSAGFISSHASDITLTDLSENGSPLQSPDSRSPIGHAGREGKEKDKDSGDTSQVRANYSLAASAMLPAIFVLVPSGLSVSGSLVQGINNANSITHNTTATDSTGLTSNLAFTVGLNVVQVAIGITVGLFGGTLLMYPFGKGGKWASNKMRSELFTF